MEKSLDAKELYCEKCGAPVMRDAICVYCSDARILGERQQLCRDFLDQMNRELEALPGGLGWLILLIWWGIPLLVIAGIWIFPGTFHILIWILLAVIAFFITTVIAGGMRDKYRRRIYTNRMAGLLDQFLIKNQVAYDYMLILADNRFPEKSAIRELIAEGKRLEHFLQ